MIDIINGTINVGKGFFVSKGLTKEEFCTSELYKEVISETHTKGVNYCIKPQMIGNVIFSISIQFNIKNMIEIVNLSHSENIEALSWENYSLDNEKIKKAWHDNWLKVNLGDPKFVNAHGWITYKYSWGEISSVCDPHTTVSSIVFRYNQ